MRISDWSSDVCSSDLRRIERLAGLDGDDHVSDRTLIVETAGVAVRGHLGAGRGQQMHILDLAVALVVLARDRERNRLADRQIVDVVETEAREHIRLRVDRHQLEQRLAAIGVLPIGGELLLALAVAGAGQSALEDRKSVGWGKSVS